ncbi:MAG: glycosyltransferase family 39 protein [Firmicutes bacterium]|nr:glycosyltransferase family 39 protein [Bacillota bacterium]
MKFKDLVMYSEEEKAEAKPISPTAWRVIFFGVWIALLNILAVIYITKSEYIYFWDSATYWDIAKQIESGALMPNIFESLYGSIGSMNYNYTAGLLSAAVMHIFGNSRLVYVLTLVNLYLVPSMIIIYLIARKMGKAPEITLTLVMLLCPMLTFTAFVGFADVGGMIGCLLCFYWYGEKDGAKTSLWKFFAIGVMLVLIMIWRRWYAFFSLSFITAMFADCIINKKPWYGALITAAASALILILCFRDFTVNILLADYANLYSDYKFAVSTDFKLITRYFGVVYILALAAASGVIMVKKKDARALFMWIQMIVCACTFMATQTHGQQHLLLYTPSIIMLTIYVIKNITKEWMLVSAAALAAAHTVNVYIPYDQPSNIQDIKIYAPIPNFSMLPRYTEYAYPVLDLKLKLNEVIGEGETLGVLASSFDLNEDALRNAESSLGVAETREDYIVSLPQVDSRDLDLTAYGAVDYVLTASPAQTHLADGSQRIVEEALNDFEAQTGIASAFEEIYDFNTQIGDMNIRLYKRVRDIPEYEYTSLSKRIE